MTTQLCSAHDIIALHAKKITDWYNNDKSLIEPNDLLQAIELNHLNNFSLWLDEDKARRDDKGFEYVYNAKRNIDHYNQQRNNQMENIDQILFNQLQPLTQGGEFHSETPGMIIDRLSILSLKQYHMHLQTQRNDVDDVHQKNCHDKYNIICLQLTHLGEFLDKYLRDIQDKKRSFRLYKQFKMYNDKSLNPELYQPAES